MRARIKNLICTTLKQPSGASRRSHIYMYTHSDAGNVSAKRQCRHVIGNAFEREGDAVWAESGGIMRAAAGKSGLINVCILNCETAFFCCKFPEYKMCAEEIMCTDNGHHRIHCLLLE